MPTREEELMAELAEVKAALVKVCAERDNLLGQVAADFETIKAYQDAERKSEKGA
jgi:hypothetical protein